LESKNRASGLKLGFVIRYLVISGKLQSRHASAHNNNGDNGAG
jgi:hypothetical protein